MKEGKPTTDERIGVFGVLLVFITGIIILGFNKITILDFIFAYGYEIILVLFFLGLFMSLWAYSFNSLRDRFYRWWNDGFRRNKNES